MAGAEDREETDNWETWVEIFGEYQDENGHFIKDTPVEALTAYRKFMKWFERLTASDEDYYINR